jgi:hypothetical protein
MPPEEKERKRQITTLECVKIIEKHTSGKSFSHISKELNISKIGSKNYLSLEER